MKRLRVLKYLSLYSMFFCIGTAIGEMCRHEYLRVMFSVICCAINHFCYNYYDK